MKREWQDAADVIAAGGSTTAAGDAAGVDARTIRRWQADEPQFADYVEDKVGETMAVAAAKLAVATPGAVKVLIRNMESDKPANTAAVKVLELALKWRMDVFIEKRLRQVEVIAGIRSSDNQP